MKQVLTLSFLFLFGISNHLQAQIPDGSIAPDWTLTDIDGNSHNLYSYLDQGKMVIIEFSATWCGPCWNYMLTGALEEVWEDHGPNGDNTAMLFYIEADQNTGMADLLGQTPSSQGNWVEAIPFPIIDLQVGENQDQQYQINYYPTLFAVCSDHTVWELGQVPASIWSSFIQSCTLAGNIENVEEATCYGEGSITVDYTGGVAPISYDWSNGATTPTISNLGAGLYSVTLTDAGGKWVVMEDIEVEGATSPLDVQQALIEEPLCNGSSEGGIDLEMEGGTPGYLYDWSNGSSSEDLVNAPAGIYSVVVTDNNGCTFEEEFTIGEPDEIEAAAELTPENCDQGDGTITLDVSGGTGDYQVTSSSGDVIGLLVINLEAGSVSVEIEDDNGCVLAQEYEIEFLPEPEVEIYQGVELNCVQLTTTLTGFAWSGSGDFDYDWSTTNGNIVSGHNSETVTIDQEGTYNLVVLDFISGCETSSSFVVTADIVLPAVNAGDDLPISCEILTPEIQGSGDPLNSITWTTTTGIIVEGEHTYTPTVSAAGLYFINVVNTETGCSNTDTVEVLDQINPANAAYQYQTSSLTVITTDVSTGSNLSGWSWTFGDGNTSNDQSPVHTYAAPGTYEVCLSVQNGCGVSQTCSQVTVTSSGSVLNIVAQVNNVLCHGDSTGSISLTVNGGSGNYTYLWTGPDGSSYNTPSIEDLIAGAYIVVVSDDLGNSVLGGYNVEQPAELLIGASSVVDNLCSGQTNGSITVELTGGVGPYSYSWNGAPPQAENSITNLPGGNYECLVTDVNGCTLLIGPYTINEPSALVSESVLGTPLCHGDANGSITVNVSGGVAPYTYQWEGNESQSDTLTGLIAGNYILHVTDANGCIMDVSILLTQPEVLQSAATEVKDASGPQQSDGSITIQVTGGTGPYIVTWSNGATGTTIQGLVPGEYTYTIQDAHGCIYTSPAPVVVSYSTATTEPDGSVYVTITPNPSDGKVVVNWKDVISQESSLTLMTLEGQNIGTYKINTQEGSWDLSKYGLAEGLYIIMLKHDQKVYPFKLIVL